MTLRANLMIFGSLMIASAQAQDGFSGRQSTVILTPTESVVQMSLQTDQQKTLDDVLAKVKDAGLAVENLATITSIPGISSPIPNGPSVPGSNTYTFRLTVPLAQTTPTLQKLLQFSAANSDLRASVGVAGVSASLATIQEAQRSNFPDLFRQAKSRAQQMASDAGLSAGRVLAVTDSYQYITVASIYSTLQVPLSVVVRLAISKPGHGPISCTAWESALLQTKQVFEFRFYGLRTKSDL